MLEENLARALKRAWLISLVAMGIAVFFDWRISTGILLGIVAMSIYSFLLNERVDSIINLAEFRPSRRFSPSYFVRIGVLLVALYLSFQFSDVLSWIGVFTGFMIYRVMLITSQLRK